MTRAVLLDLGNVVLGVDFRRVFDSWAGAAGVSTDRFYQHWQIDEPYRRHERGEISFAEYSAHLAELFDITLTDEQWETGWNDIWTEPFHSVIDVLPEVAARYPLYCFTNTNNTHTRYWREQYATALESFEHIFVSSEIGVRKPDVESFHHVCTTMQTTPDRVLFVDDTRENVDGALRAGLKTAHVKSETAVLRTLQALLS